MALCLVPFIVKSTLMKKHLFPLPIVLLVIIITSCESYYPVQPIFAQRAQTYPVKEPGDIFVTGYKMPKVPYIELGHFSLPLVSAYGDMMALLPSHVAQQGFDGAIVLNSGDKASGEIRYIGIIYESNINRLGGIVNKITITELKNDSVSDRSVVYLNWNRQVDSVVGDLNLYNRAKLVQPWFFLDQQNRGWVQASSIYPFASRKYGSASHGLSYKYMPQAEPTTFLFSNSPAYDRYRIVLDESRNVMVLQQVEYKDRTELVHSVFIGDKLVKQLWDRPEKGEQIQFDYSYKSKEDLPAQWIVQPDDLVGLK